MSRAPFVRDLRLLLPAVGTWAGVLAGLHGGVVAFLLLGPLFLLAYLAGARVAVVVALLCAAGAGSAGLRVAAVEANPVTRLAASQAWVSAEGRLVSDPTSHPGQFGDVVTVRLSVDRVEARNRVVTGRAPVLLVGGDELRLVRLGQRVRVIGRLAPATDADVAGVLLVRTAPDVLAAPGWGLRLADGLRADIREAVAHAPPVPRALVPGLVDGDDSDLSQEVRDEFRTAGLTHLTAVSGTNLTLVLGFVLAIGRWVGVRAHGRLVLGAVGIVAFVVLARPEPSVLRAAVMGSVALVGLGAGGRATGLRCLSLSALVLLLLDPWLGASAGFALSVLATLGILLAAPPVRDALASWMPRWSAEAVAVPLAAQLACTPLVAAISGQVSLVAVLANLLVGWAVGPATVLGLAGGLLLSWWPWAGDLCGRGAGLFAGWVVVVADRAAALPVATIGWSRGLVGLGALTVICGGLLLLAPRWAGSRGGSLACVAVLAVALVRPLPTPGWPPDGWVMVACDVGQGDGLVLRAGPATAVVVDAGPDPALMNGCLRRLGVRSVPLVVLTHFHADHVDGLRGVGRGVREIDVSGLRDPAEGAASVDAYARKVDATVRVPVASETRTVGDLRLRVVGPVTPPVAAEGPNNASLVLLVEVAGLRLLLTGDVEPEAQRRLARAVGTLDVDVLKVPHHGSRYQDLPFLTGFGARLAVVSVGKDNDYGHPAASTLAALASAGMEVRRTDEDGDIAVVSHDGHLAVATR